MEATLMSGPSSSKWNMLQYAMVSCYSIGLHASISLPFYIVKYSVTFLLAHYIMLLSFCVPVCYVQMKLGAIYRQNIFGIFSLLVPILKGCAIAILIFSYIRCLTGSLELSYCLYYAFASFVFPYDDSTHPNHWERSGHQMPIVFFKQKFLQISDGLSEGGHLVWYIALALLITWFIVYLLTIKEPSFIAKLACVVVPTALSLLLVTLIYGWVVPLPGAPSEKFSRLEIINGTLTYHERDLNEEEIEKELPVWNISLSKLYSPQPWMNSLLLHIYSLGLWSGVIPTLGAHLYNKQDTIVRANVVLLVVYGLFPVVFGIASIPYISTNSGYGMFEYGERLKPGLDLLLLGMFGKIRHVPGIALCLYLGIYLFGILHMTLHLLVVWDALLTSFPAFLLQFFRKRSILVAILCFLSFVFCIPYCFQGGVYLYMLVSSYLDRLIFTVIIVSIVPTVIGYIKQNLVYLLLERALMSLWHGLSSLVIAAMLIYYFAVYVYPYPATTSDPRANNKADEGGQCLGWFIAIGPIVLGFIVGAFHAVYTEKGSFKERCIRALKSESLQTADSSCDYDMYGKTPHTSTTKSNSDVTLSKIDTEVVVNTPGLTSELAKV
ncbi:sodium- and chloride-dependent GABA transporter 1-like [Saccostrea echinata]|uniref:sodium- and chloride-dependent GABA transporter 1-like n=1 Tax=Saccostrea echinata TaxID=191078 RepID=UPI002A83753F|nr:sodium- and chloride-dependent GABA transporter 1-like [Saccostrea echinata]XP_061171702.1 sodium- and chloride-dependent GABA transporter 1-like [Saccostrea echinata]